VPADDVLPRAPLGCLDAHFAAKRHERMALEESRSDSGSQASTLIPEPSCAGDAENVRPAGLNEVPTFRWTCPCSRERGCVQRESSLVSFCVSVRVLSGRASRRR